MRDAHVLNIYNFLSVLNAFLKYCAEKKCHLVRLTYFVFFKGTVAFLHFLRPININRTQQHAYA